MKKFISYHTIFHDDWLDFQILNDNGKLVCDFKPLTKKEVIKHMTKSGFKRKEYIIIKRILEVIK